MLHALLAVAAQAAQATRLDMLEEIHREVVTEMPWGGFSTMYVLIALTLVATLWCLWSQRTLAANQVRIAMMLNKHLNEHLK